MLGLVKGAGVSLGADAQKGQWEEKDSARLHD